ncbi:MAG: hypothetical protein IH618_03135 [Ignavibacteriaceae bacterium]|nr:hypothetical protein [Ignavibacteriaceae bacterium]
MKITEHTPIKLTIKDSAGCIWLLGFFFLAIAGTFVLGLSGLFINLNEINELEKLGAWIVSLSGVAAGIWIIYSHPGIYITFDKSIDAVTINRRGLLKDETETYKLSEIEDIIINESVDSEGDPFFRLAIKLKDKRQINFSSTGGHDRDAQQKHAALIKTFL